MARIKHLAEYHKRAMELKYKGNSYQDIAEKLNEYAEKSRINRKFTMQTIKDWFKEGGTLAETYCIYEQELDGINRETMNVIRRAGVRIRSENFRLANEMLVALMGSGNDHVKLGAIKELLDRVEGKPKEINIQESRSDPIMEMSYEQQLREIRKEYGNQSK